MNFEAHAAFFYPQDTQDPVRLQRAKALGLDKLPNEYNLSQSAEPLFPRHDQPRTYQLKGRNTWEDTDPVALGLQLELAQDAGLTCFFIDTYQGQFEGKASRELQRPLNQIAQLEAVQSGRFKFANFAILGSSRVQFPLIPDRDGTSEANRSFDLSPQTADYIIQVQHQYWGHPGYLHINEKPVMGVYFPRDVFNKIKINPQSALNFLQELKHAAMRVTDIEPYLVGTITSPGPNSMEFLTQLYCQGGIDALTSYAFLANFHDGPFIQNYSQLVQDRIKNWQTVASLSTVPFWPSAVPGWDASPRGPRGVDPKEAEGLYPFHPIVEGANAQDFGLMLQAAIHFILANSPDNQRVSVVCTWNEVGEGMAMLPREINGQLDTSILEEHKRVIDSI